MLIVCALTVQSSDWYAMCLSVCLSVCLLWKKMKEVLLSII